MPILRALFLVLAAYFTFVALPASQAANFKTTERVKHYSVSGTTGPELYASIGQNGPRISGGRRTIALTDWDLKWRRDYRPQSGSGGQSCRLRSAKPFFTLIYTLPKPTARLRGATARYWKIFYDGLAAHEKIHGAYASDMVATIIRTTVGLTVENDPRCRKIRAQVLTRVKAALTAYNERSRAFDRHEMAAGGVVERLVRLLLESG
ncbi:MAG: DUF922 domain-containing protein [Rhizobiaceae bacterium]